MKKSTVMRFLLILCVLLVAPFAAAQKVVLSFASNPMVLLNVEMARSVKEQKQGLMWREQLPKDSGMVFINKVPKKMCMWMKNTLLPLDIGFIDKNHKMTEIKSMRPLDTSIYCTKSKVLYALEVNRGWFQQRNIKVGDYVRHLPK